MLTRSDQHLQCPCKEGRKSSERDGQKQRTRAMEEAGDPPAAQGLMAPGFQLLRTPGYGAEQAAREHWGLGRVYDGNTWGGQVVGCHFLLSPPKTTRARVDSWANSRQRFES